VWDERLFLGDVWGWYCTSIEQLRRSDLWGGLQLRPAGPSVFTLTSKMHQALRDSRTVLHVDLARVMFATPATSNSFYEPTAQWTAAETPQMMEAGPFVFDLRPESWPLSLLAAVMPGDSLQQHSPATTSGYRVHGVSAGGEEDPCATVCRRCTAGKETVLAQEAEIRALIAQVRSKESIIATQTVDLLQQRPASLSRQLKKSGSGASDMDLEAGQDFDFSTPYSEGLMHRRLDAKQSGSLSSKMKWRFRRLGDLSPLERIWLRGRLWILLYILCLHLVFPIIAYHLFGGSEPEPEPRVNEEPEFYYN